tara:strand:- start:533 stop:1210 length:678 start_codon:yes stop_codon:yes gene_type:complete
MKNILSFILLFGLMNINCEKPKKEGNVSNQSIKKNENQKEIDNLDASKQESEVAVISTKYGDMVIEFFDEVAPKHVESFKLHVKNGYYDGTIFHRVIPGFMIQGGDPNTKSENKASYGTGGHAAKYYGIGIEEDKETWNLPAEFNNINHTRGILSMARSNNPNSGGSQFFICASDAPHLNGNYTVFGQIIEGDRIIDQIINLPRDARDNPNRRVEMKVVLEKRNR